MPIVQLAGIVLEGLVKTAVLPPSFMALTSNISNSFCSTPQVTDTLSPTSQAALMQSVCSVIEILV